MSPLHVLVACLFGCVAQGALAGPTEDFEELLAEAWE